MKKLQYILIRHSRANNGIKFGVSDFVSIRKFVNEAIAIVADYSVRIYNKLLDSKDITAIDTSV